MIDVLSVLVDIVNAFLTLYFILLLLRALISWFPVDPNSPLVRFLHAATEPIVQPIRAILPPMGMMDFSVFVATLIVLALQRVLNIVVGR